jgi:hypothetical protein
MKVAQQFIAGFKQRGRFRPARDDRNNGLFGFLSGDMWRT